MEFVKELPPDNRGRTNRSGSLKWQKVAAELKKHPGEWALIEKDVYFSTATNIKKGIIKAFSNTSDWEVAIRNSHQSRGELYMRYVGKEE
jgi:hypothetical protein